MCNASAFFARWNMKIGLANGFCVAVTPYNEKYDLIQKFRGLEMNGSKLYNQPVDFMESGLMQKNKWDYWHIDIPFALNTDEAVPAFINGSFIGANHGHHGAVSAYAPAHGKTVADVGSLWIDEAGVAFTLMRVENENGLLFLSQNVGKSVERYAFVTRVTGKLAFVENGKNTADIVCERQGSADLRRAIRHSEKRVLASVNGEEKAVLGAKECEYAEIHEHYAIINPATVAEDLRNRRPANGYEAQPDLADFGKPMLDCRLIYRIENDGTVYTRFDYKKLMDVHFERWMGVMYQEKLDVYKGGSFRYFPKALPFTCEEGTFDFSVPTAICDKPFPRSKRLLRTDFCDEGAPCERAVEYFRDENGADKVAFACGYLPLYDGEPAIRDKNVQSEVSLKFTRKHYPTFAEGDVQNVKGIGYKKYFIPSKDKASYYKVGAEGKTYIYADIFETNTLQIPITGNVKRIEKQGDIEYTVQNGTLTVHGNKGFVSFIEE